LFVGTTLDISALLERTMAGLGYELVQVEKPARGGLLRVYIDRVGGITLEDCAFVSSHLSRVLAADDITYDRLEVSSPGLDRPLRPDRDFDRFIGHIAQVRTKVAIGGRKRFTGAIREGSPGHVVLEVDAVNVSIDLNNIERARLVPDLQGGGRS
jgi:ribosome maturation factor RimP